MTTLARRSTGSMMSELLDWLDQGSPAGVRGLGLAPYVRVEDYTEDDTYVLRAEMPGIDPDKDVTLNIDEDVLNLPLIRFSEKWMLLYSVNVRIDVGKEHLLRFPQNGAQPHDTTAAAKINDVFLGDVDLL